jgi:hypothetical protein
MEVLTDAKPGGLAVGLVGGSNRKRKDGVIVKGNGYRCVLLMHIRHLSPLPPDHDYCGWAGAGE